MTKVHEVCMSCVTEVPSVALSPVSAPNNVQQLLTKNTREVTFTQFIRSNNKGRIALARDGLATAFHELFRNYRQTPLLKNITQDEIAATFLHTEADLKECMEVCRLAIEEQSRTTGIVSKIWYGIGDVARFRTETVEDRVERACYNTIWNVERDFWIAHKEWQSCDTEDTGLTLLLCSMRKKFGVTPDKKRKGGKHAKKNK